MPNFNFYEIHERNKKMFVLFDEIKKQVENNNINKKDLENFTKLIKDTEKLKQYITALEYI